ncbi:OmpA family protein [Nitratifractor sp.]
MIERVKRLEFDCYDEEEIRKKLLPLFDSLLLASLEKKGGQTLEILSRSIAEIIARKAQSDPEELGRALQPVISPAIKEEIADNRDQMIDVLYPILGGMIARYVTNAIRELLETIDRKIEERLSFQKIKRKIKARLSGVSETELLLEESFTARILSIFIVQRESGLLIAESNWGDTEIDDPQMVASMASAIKDFINDWIRETREVSEVQLVSYGTSSLYIENAGSVYLIAFLEREPDYEQRERINEFFAKLLKKHHTFFAKFDGDSRAEEIKEIEQAINEFIAQINKRVSQDEKSDSAVPVRIVLLILLLLILLPVGYRLYRDYRIHLLEEKIRQKTALALKLDSEGDRWIVSGTVPDLRRYDEVRSVLSRLFPQGYVERLNVPLYVLESLHDKLVESIRKNKEKVSTLKEDFRHLAAETTTDQKAMEQIRRQIDMLQKSFDRLRDTLRATTMQLQEQKAKLSRAENIAKIRSIILDRLGKVFGNDPRYHRKDGSFDFKNGGLFDEGKAVPKAQSLAELKKVFEKYITILLANPKIRPYIRSIEIDGYTDSKGKKETNLRLSAARAEHVKSYLASLPLAKKLGADRILISRGMGSKDPILVDGHEDAEASRRIKIAFHLDDRAILKSLQDSLK